MALGGRGILENTVSAVPYSTALWCWCSRSGYPLAQCPEPEHQYPLYTVSDEWLDDSLVLSMVFVVLRSLTLRQLLHLVPICQLTRLARDESDDCLVILKLYELVVVVGGDTVACVAGVEERTEQPCGVPVFSLSGVGSGGAVEVWGPSVTLCE